VPQLPIQSMPNCKFCVFTVKHQARKFSARSKRKILHLECTWSTANEMKTRQKVNLSATCPASLLWALSDLLLRIWLIWVTVALFRKMRVRTGGANVELRQIHERRAVAWKRRNLIAVKDHPSDAGTLVHQTEELTCFHPAINVVGPSYPRRWMGRAWRAYRTALLL